MALLPDQLERLERQAAMLGSLRHENIVQARFFGRQHGGVGTAETPCWFGWMACSLRHVDASAASAAGTLVSQQGVGGRLSGSHASRTQGRGRSRSVAFSRIAFTRHAAALPNAALPAA